MILSAQVRLDQPLPCRLLVAADFRPPFERRQGRARFAGGFLQGCYQGQQFSRDIEPVGPLGLDPRFQLGSVGKYQLREERTAVEAYGRLELLRDSPVAWLTDELPRRPQDVDIDIDGPRCDADHVPVGHQERAGRVAERLPNISERRTQIRPCVRSVAPGQGRSAMASSRFGPGSSAAKVNKGK